MSYNGSGTFNANSSGLPVVTGTTITVSMFNAMTADLATGLTTAICKDGQTTTSARIPFLFGIDSSLTTNSTSITTGSIITAGGVGITKALWVGGLANIAGAATISGSATISGRTITAQGANVASANNLTVGTDGNLFVITGTTQINLLDSTGWTTGSMVFLRFSDNLTVKHGQTTSGVYKLINLAGSADFSATLSDVLMLILVGGEWHEVSRTVI